MTEAQHQAWETIQRGHALQTGIYVVSPSTASARKAS